MKNSVKRAQGRKMYWLGMRRGKSGDGKIAWYVDTHGEPSFEMDRKKVQNKTLPWGQQEPGTLGDCATIDSALQWKWNGVSCSISAYLVCQRNGAQR